MSDKGSKQQRRLSGIYSLGGAALITGPSNPPVTVGLRTGEKVQWAEVVYFRISRMGGRCSGNRHGTGGRIIKNLNLFGSNPQQP
jgi:hypothetical protein